MKSDAMITFFVDDENRPTVRIADGVVWLSFGTGSTRVAVAVTQQQAVDLIAGLHKELYAAAFANEVAA